MDWFDQSDNLFVENECEPLAGDNEIKIENVFMKKRSSATDYELDIDDFILENSETRKNSKLFSSVDNNCIEDINGKGALLNSKIFEVNKEKRREQNCRTKKNHLKLTMEEVEKYPFLNTTPKIYDKKRLVHPNNIKTNDSILITIEQNNEFNCTQEKLNEMDNHNGNNMKKVANSDMREDNNLLNNNVSSNNPSPCNIMPNIKEYFSFENKFIQHNFINSNNFYFNKYDVNNHDALYFQRLQFSERMKLKREKTKMLLEKKTKRERYDLRKVDECDRYSTFMNNGSNISYLISSRESNCSPSNKTKESHSTFLKTPSKKFFKSEVVNKGKNNDVCNNDGLFDSAIQTHLSKREFKMLKNRISAQKSRDRKKKEVDELKAISDNLINENSYLKKEIENRDKEIDDIKKKMNLICKSCESVEVKQNIILQNPPNNPNQYYSIVDVSGRSFSSDLKYSLMLGFLVVVCLIGAFSIRPINETHRIIHNYNGRLLNSLEINNELSKVNKNIPLMNPNRNFIDNSYYKSNYSNNWMFEPGPKDTSSNRNYRNDTELLLNKNNHDDQTPNPYSLFTNLNKFFKKLLNKLQDKNESDLLNKKSNEFYLKMQKRIIEENNNKNDFLRMERNEMDICINTELLTWSIQDEREIRINDQVVPTHIKDIEQMSDDKVAKNSAITFKQNSYHHTYRYSSINPVLPLRESAFQFENPNLRDNIKSMYCREFISSEGQNTFFRDLFNKLNIDDNVNDEESDDNKSNSNDNCMYLHMIIPSENNEHIENKSKKAKIDMNNFSEKEIKNFNKTTENNSLKNNDENQKENTEDITNKKVYYEVGCKIFEINKIYK